MEMGTNAHGRESSLFTACVCFWVKDSIPGISTKYPGGNLIKILLRLSFLLRFLLRFLIKNLVRPYKILSQDSYKNLVRSYKIL